MVHELVKRRQIDLAADLNHLLASNTSRGCGERAMIHHGWNIFVGADTNPIRLSFR
jgi:hypothetical protein